MIIDIMTMKNIFKIGVGMIVNVTSYYLLGAVVYNLYLNDLTSTYFIYCVGKWKYYCTGDERT